MDMPKLDEYMAQYLTPLVSSGKVTLAELGKSQQLLGCVTDLMSMAPAKMFAAVLKDIAAKEVCVCASVFSRAKKDFCHDRLFRSGLFRSGRVYVVMI